MYEFLKLFFMMAEGGSGSGTGEGGNTNNGTGEGGNTNNGTGEGGNANNGTGEGGNANNGNSGKKNNNNNNANNNGGKTEKELAEEKVRLEQEQLARDQANAEKLNEFKGAKTYFDELSKKAKPTSEDKVALILFEKLIAKVDKGELEINVAEEAKIMYLHHVGKDFLQKEFFTRKNAQGENFKLSTTEANILKKATDESLTADDFKLFEATLASVTERYQDFTDKANAMASKAGIQNEVTDEMIASEKDLVKRSQLVKLKQRQENDAKRNK